MIPHFIVNEKTNLILHFTFDFNKTTTLLSLQQPTKDGFKIIKEKTVDDLLRHAVSIGNHWFVATMKVRKWGSPAFIEEWDWETLELVKKYPIEHDRYGLMNFSISPKGDTVLIDRFFVENDPDQNGCKIFSYPALTEVGAIPINSNLQSPTFDDTGDKLIVVHTDQGGAETMLFERKNGKFDKKFQFAQRQVTADMTFTAVAYTKHGILLFSLFGYPDQLGLYDIDTGECKFLNEIEKSATHIKEEIDPLYDYKNFEVIMSNVDLSIYADDSYAYVGRLGSIFKIDISSGTVESAIEIPELKYILQIKKLGNFLIAIDHAGKMGKIEI